MDGITCDQLLGTVEQPFGIAIVMRQPLLEDLMDRRAFPPRRMISIDRIEFVKLEHGARVESERIGLQPVERGDVDYRRSIFDRGTWPRARDGLMLAGVVDRLGQALKPEVAGEATGH